MSPNQILPIYDSLARAYGPLHWWPARSRFEVIVGAFLTQNTSWKNVELALKNLRRAGVLNVGGIRRTPITRLEELIRPSGYFRQKAARLKGFVAYLDRRHAGSLSRMFSQPVESLRDELLALNGVGPETADAILLYAGKLPVFVVDNYARRVFTRHGILNRGEKYEQIRSLVEDAMTEVETRHPASSLAREELVHRLNEFHALLVEVGKRHCGKMAKCSGCPLEPLLPAKNP